MNQHRTMIVGENDPRSLGGDLMGFIPALVAVRVDHLFLWDIVTASPLPILQNRPPTAILKWQWAGYSVRDFLKVINPSSQRHNTGICDFENLRNLVLPLVSRTNPAS